MSYNVAVVGATGNVGQEMLAILDERQFPVREAFAIASRQSIGREVSFGDTTLKCRDLETFDFSKVDIALFAAGGSDWPQSIVAPLGVDLDEPGFWSKEIGRASCRERVYSNV